MSPPFRGRARATYASTVDPLLALAVVGALLAVSIGVGLVLRARSGRRVRTRDDRVAAAELGLETHGSLATVVQFSTELCSRCPAVRRTLSRATADDPGVALTEVDLTHRPDLATRFRVLTTPTVLVLDPSGSVRARFSGAVTAATIREEISALRRIDDVPTR